MKTTVIALSVAVSPSLIAQEMAAGMTHAEVIPFQQMLNAHATALNASLQALTNSIKICSAKGMVYGPGVGGADATACVDLPITKCAKAGKDFYPGASGADAGGCVARGIPTSTVAAFNLPVCPSGWSDMPSMAGRVIVGVGDLGTESYGLRSAGGVAMRMLAASNLPRHRHAIQGGTGALVYEAKSDSHATVRALDPYENWGTSNAPYTKMTDHYPVNVGDQSAFDNRQPFLALRYCIKR